MKTGEKKDDRESGTNQWGVQGRGASENRRPTYNLKGKKGKFMKNFCQES